MSNKKSYDDERIYFYQFDLNFLNKHYMKIMVNSEYGGDCLVTYLALIAISTEWKGYVRYSKDRTFTTSDLGELMGYSTKKAEKILNTLKELELVKAVGKGTLYLPKWKKMTNWTTVGAIKKAKQRERRKAESEEQEKGVDKGWTQGGHCPVRVQQNTKPYSLDHMSNRGREIVSNYSSKDVTIRNQLLNPTINQKEGVCFEGIEPHELWNEAMKSITKMSQGEQEKLLQEAFRGDDDGGTFRNTQRAIVREFGLPDNGEFPLQAQAKFDPRFNEDIEKTIEIAKTKWVRDDDDWGEEEIPMSKGRRGKT